ncbi:MAG: hypothetical protein SFV24_15265 [Gemmatimonadales bacterium]|nr:hypothetical protein [Gemmatimonadales bacterium]
MQRSVALLFAAAGSACADPPPDPWTTVPFVDNPAPADRLQLVADPIAAPVLPGLATARFADDRGALLVLVPEMRAVRVDKFGGQPGKGGWELRSIDPPRFQDTVVEVFDPALKRVLATGRLDESCRGFSRSGDLYCDEQNDDGTFRLEIRPVRVRALVRATLSR